ncbi:MAG: hypothetical protein WBQ23_11370 [Bacteroidota bacterium]
MTAFSDMTEDHIISLLVHGTLPAVLVEGKDDMTAIRYLESKLGPTRATFINCGCRKRLMNVYARREEFENRSVVFLADLDTFVFTGVPLVYSEIIFTSGYSIENDVLPGSPIWQLFEVEEKNNYEQDLAEFLKWYSYEVEECFAGRASNLALHPNNVLRGPGRTFDAAVVTQRVYRRADDTTISYIAQNCLKLVRGHSLFELIVYYLSSRHRESKYSKHNLLEISIKNNASAWERTIISCLRARLA